MNMPRRPEKPIKPLKFKEKENKAIDVADYTLNDLLNEIGEIDRDDAFFEFDGEYVMYLHYKTSGGLNPNYDKDLVKYEADMVRYKVDVVHFIKNMEKFHEHHLETVKATHKADIEYWKKEL